jgi:hypothetical protein
VSSGGLGSLGAVGDGGGVTRSEPPTPPGRRRFASVGDMVRSVVLVLGFVLVIVWLTPRQESDPVRTIDYTGPLERARAAASYQVYAPVGLPPGWRATSARLERTPAGEQAWQLGFVTPSDRYAAVQQSDGDPAGFVDAVAMSGRAQGSARVGGLTWQRRHAEDEDQRTLWRREAGSTVTVAGNASWAELEQLAAALRAG